MTNSYKNFSDKGDISRQKANFFIGGLTPAPGPQSDPPVIQLSGWGAL